MEVRFILGLILFACVNNVFQELLPVTVCYWIIFHSRERLGHTWSHESELSMDAQGGGGYFRNFWVGMCRWDP